jgi:hypothetical protein
MPVTRTFWTPLKAISGLSENKLRVVIPDSSLSTNALQTMEYVLRNKITLLLHDKDVSGESKCRAGIRNTTIAL